MYVIKPFTEDNLAETAAFLEKCLPESGRALEMDGRHRIYRSIEACFLGFWCLFEDQVLIGTVGIRACMKNPEADCELKFLYLYQKYYGKGLGYRLLYHAIGEGKRLGFQKMYLDTLSTSKRAVALYERAGFAVTECYNQNKTADLFLVLDLTGQERERSRKGVIHGQSNDKR